ncbi:MAG: response regulator [Planctomycetota bacterium]
MADADKPRVLILNGQTPGGPAATELLSGHYDVRVVGSTEDAMSALREGEFRAVFAEVGDYLPMERELVGDRSSLVLNTIGEGVCIVDRSGQLTWSNKRMKTFSEAITDKVKRVCQQALGIFNAQAGGFTAAGPDGEVQYKSKKSTFESEDRYFEVICSPIIESEGETEVEQVVAVVWDATNSKRLQSKIDAIDASGRELARLDANELSKLAPPQRLKLLQDKIIRFSKDLMHFDHFNIRLLDRDSRKLEMVISEGLPPEALEIDLYAQPEGNGISGYVGATGRSYICHDTEKDPRYVLGLQHGKSSLTVPLMLFDEVIGVYNIESEQTGAFNEDDRQFAEIFGRYVALALNILDLLVVERYTTSTSITDSVVHEMAEPLADIATNCQGLLDQGDAEASGPLQSILRDVERIRETIKQVQQGPKAVVGNDDGEADVVDPVIEGKRILVADDESNIRETIKSVLARRGAEVEVCKDGYEACSLLTSTGFDLIVSDIRMPYRNGYEIFAAAQRIKEGTPVLLMTGFGYDPHHSIVRASTEGLAGVLFKPFKVDEFVGEVRKALGAEAE